MGGTGKTQIAVEYAYRYSTKYEAVWWLRAEDEKTLAADYAAFATAVGLPEKDAAEERVIIDAVRNWFAHHPDWLLIVDNAVKPDDIIGYLPQGPSGHVLITSRHQSWGSLCASLHIDKWPRNESVAFLHRRTKFEDRSDAESVAETLGDLPLALEQAAAYIDGTGIRYDDYLNLYRTRRRDLWDEQNPPVGYPDTVVTTWSLAIEKVQEEAPAGAMILNCCAYLAPDNIPRSLIHGACDYLPPDIYDLINDTIAFNKGLKELNQYSLVTAQTNTLSVHRLVQAVVRDRLRTDERELWSQAAVQSVNASFSNEGLNNPKVWPQCAALLSHAMAVTGHADAMKVAMESVATLSSKMATYLQGRASYPEAEPLFRRALEIRKAQLGDDHPSVATSLNNLAKLLQAQGKYTEAEPLFRRALEIREAQLGDDHPYVAQSLNNLAGLLKDQGKYTEADPLHRWALEILETQLGDDHPNTTKIRKNLENLLSEISSTDGNE